ncbi:MAG: serine hydrolase domain-containing protein [Pseudomonadota bacterium]
MLNRRSFLAGTGLTGVLAACGQMGRTPSAVTELGSSIDATDPMQRGVVLAVKARQLGLPGAVLAVQEASAPMRIEAVGLADVLTNAPVLTNSWMRLGSVSKLFVGHIVLKLADEGSLGLDDPVSAYRDDVPAGEDIALRMLGNHTSGLYNPIYSPEFRNRINATPSRKISREEMFQVAWENTETPPKIGNFKYSNANTALLADIAERASGVSIEALLERYVIATTGKTGLRFAEDHILPNPSARGYRYGPDGGGVEYGNFFFDATEFSASWADAAGDTYGQAETVLASGLHVLKGSGLSDKMISEQRDFIRVEPGFGYAFCIANYGGVIGHAGDVPGFSSFVGWCPAQDIGIAVLTNLSNFVSGSSPASDIGKAMLSCPV